MSITLTTPVSRQSATTVRLVGILVDINNRQAQLVFDIGYMQDEEFVKIDTQRFIFDEDETGEKSEAAFAKFSALLSNVPEMANLKDALEAAAVQFSIFDGTTV